MKKIKLFCSIINKVKKQVYKFKSYLWKRRLEKVFKEIKESAEFCYNLEQKRIGQFPTYYDNTPDFSLCLKRDSTNSFSNKAFSEWQKRKEKGEWIPQIPPVHRSVECQ